MNTNEEIAVPEKLYHYTSKEGFLGIIENKTLWASEILYMNDEKETRIPFEICKELLKEDKNANAKEEIDHLDEELKKLLFKELIGLETYVISFSEKKDDLNMWRAYGDNASGICMGFNSCELLEALEKNQKIKSMKWRKCIYDKQEQKNKIQNLLDSEKINIGRLSEKLREFSTYFKDESFKDEHEYRIIVELNTGENRELKKVRAGKDIFVPYYELQIEKEKLPSESEGDYPWLGDIAVGHNTTDIFYKSVLHACSVYGIGFGRVLEREPRKSDIPYRG
ncbi:MAG: DUF2971 domain-containing protein [Treponema sp.]|nr:DUF2971 domain-containing protein [Treponema sp.]